MIMSSSNNNVVNSNLTDDVEYGFELTENILETLSSRLYTNPIRAIIREITSNAIDAHTEAGVTADVLVHLPTELEPEFSVEDFGIGMDENDIRNVYAKYGNSTKNKSNNCIGGLGLGSKTPFAYTSQFTVESCKNGIKNVFVSFKKENGLYGISKMDSYECAQSGTRVSFPVELKDISSFYKEAAITFLFTNVMPKISGDMQKFMYYTGVSMEDYAKCRDHIKNTSVVTDKNTDNIIYKSSYTSPILLIMGGVAYEVNPAEILGKDKYSGLLNLIIRGNNTDSFSAGIKIIHAPIGSVNIQSSREALSYTEKTVNWINSYLVNNFVDKVIKLAA